MATGECHGSLAEGAMALNGLFLSLAGASYSEHYLGFIVSIMFEYEMSLRL